MYLVYSTAVIFLFTLPTIYCAPTIRPRQYPGNHDFDDIFPTFYPTPDVTIPDTSNFDPFGSANVTPTLSPGAIIGIVIGCIAGIALLYAIFYLFHQSNKQQRTLERQLALAAADDNNDNNNPSSQRRQQNTATGSTQQPANFHYGAEHQPYQPYREQSSSYPVTPVQPPSKSFAMDTMLEHSHRSSTAQLNASSIVSAEVHSPPPHYVSKPDEVDSSLLPSTHFAPPNAV